MDNFLDLVLGEIQKGVSYQASIATNLNASSSDVDLALRYLADNGKIHIGSKDILGNYFDISPR